MTAIQAKLEETKPGILRALIGLHAMTGSEYTVAFHGKGKVRPMKLLLESEEDFIAAFTSLSTGDRSFFSKIEKFICMLYGAHSAHNADKARRIKLYQLAGIKEKEVTPHSKKLKKLRKINCALLPPCQKVLHQKILWAQCVSQVWSKAAGKSPSESLCPANYGWRREENRWKWVWYIGSAVPETFAGSTDDDEEENDAENDEDDACSAPEAPENDEALNTEDVIDI